MKKEQLEKEIERVSKKYEIDPSTGFQKLKSPGLRLQEQVEDLDDEETREWHSQREEDLREYNQEKYKECRSYFN
jgi:hypothetical protein